MAAGTGNLILKRGVNMPYNKTQDGGENETTPVLLQGMPAAQIIGSIWGLTSSDNAVIPGYAFDNYPNRLWIGTDKYAKDNNTYGGNAENIAPIGTSIEPYTGGTAPTHPAINETRPIWMGAEIRAYTPLFEDTNDGSTGSTGPYVVLKADWDRPSDYVLATQKAISRMPLRYYSNTGLEHNPGGPTTPYIYYPYIEFNGWNGTTDGDLLRSTKYLFPSTNAPTVGHVLKIASVTAGSTPDPQTVKLEWASAGSATGTMSDFIIAADTGSSQTIDDGETITFTGGTGIDTVATNTNTITFNLDLNELTTQTVAIGDILAGVDVSDNNSSGKFAIGSVLGLLSSDVTVNTSTGAATVSATNVKAAATSSATAKVALLDNADGSAQAVKYDTDLAYNSSTNTLSVTNISATTITGTVSTATTATNVTVTTDSNSSAYRVPFFPTSGATGGLLVDSNASDFTYNPSTNTLTATNFAGNASTANSATTATTATLANNVNIITTDGNTNDTACYPVLVPALNTGSQQVHIDNSLVYNASTNVLQATKFSAEEFIRTNDTLYVSAGGGNGVVLSGLYETPSTGTGTRPTLTVNYQYNTDVNTPRYVKIEGGNLYLGTKIIEDGGPTTAVGIVFEGATANSHQTTLTVADPSATRTITLPNESGTVLVKDQNDDLLSKIRNLTITGDLQVDGTTTTINTTNLNVEDTIVTLNYGYTGNSPSDSGIEIERGSLSDVQMTWDESSKHWHAEIIDKDNVFGNGATAKIGHYPLIVGDNTDPSTETKYANSPSGAPAGTQFVHTLDVKNLVMSGTWILGANITTDVDLSSGGLVLPHTTDAAAESDETTEGRVYWETDVELMTVGTGSGYKTMVDTDSTQTLSNKTLTAPKIANAGFIADANGNEQLIFNTTANAVNEITITNAVSGTSPLIASSGNSSDIDLRLQGKGSGSVVIDDSSISTTNSTFSVFNAVANNISAFGAANTLTLGANSGTATISNVTVTAPNATSILGAAATTVSLSTSPTSAATINIGTGVNTSGTKTISIGTGGGNGGSTSITIGSCAAGHSSSNVFLGCPNASTSVVEISGNNLIFKNTGNRITVSSAATIGVNATHTLPNITSGNLVVAGTTDFNSSNYILMGGGSTTPSVYTNKDTVVVGGVRVNFQNSIATNIRYPIPFLGASRSITSADPTAGFTFTEGSYQDSYLYANMLAAGAAVGTPTNYTNGLFYEVNDTADSNVGTLFCDYIGATLDCGTYA